jgi:hypothetical protein
MGSSRCAGAGAVGTGVDVPDPNALRRSVTPIAADASTSSATRLARW